MNKPARDALTRAVAEGVAPALAVAFAVIRANATSASERLVHDVTGPYASVALWKIHHAPQLVAWTDIRIVALESENRPVIPRTEDGTVWRAIPDLAVFHLYRQAQELGEGAVGGFSAFYHLCAAALCGDPLCLYTEGNK
jgi:hypothetical protein